MNAAALFYDFYFWAALVLFLLSAAGVFWVLALLLVPKFGFIAQPLAWAAGSVLQLATVLKIKNLVKVEILMPDCSIQKGLGEESLKKVKVNDVVQFERICFARCDKKEKNKMVFWFTHR